jgi:hypothetical protein
VVYDFGCGGKSLRTIVLTWYMVYFIHTCRKVLSRLNVFLFFFFFAVFVFME